MTKTRVSYSTKPRPGMRADAPTTPPGPAPALAAPSAPPTPPAPPAAPVLRLSYAPCQGLPAYAVARLRATDALATIRADNPRRADALEALERAHLEEAWPIADLCADAIAVAGGYTRAVAAALGVSDTLVSTAATRRRAPSAELHRRLVAYVASGGKIAPDELREK
jgi:hypothetical protein